MINVPDTNDGGSRSRPAELSVPGHVRPPGMADLHRILRPGGYLAISTIDENHLDFPFIDPATEAKVRSGEIAIVNPDLAGGNECLFYHPFVYVRDKLARGFEIVDHVPTGAGKTFYLLQRAMIAN